MMNQYNRINNLKRLEPNRKALRNNLTEAENILWQCIRKRKLLGKKFRRQFSVLNYILDFYCPEEKIAIELDGQHHYSKEGKMIDMERDAFLSEQEIMVLRFENKRVIEDIEGVLNEIRNCILTLLPLRPSATSPGRGGSTHENLS